MKCCFVTCLCVLAAAISSSAHPFTENFGEASWIDEGLSSHHEEPDRVESTSLPRHEPRRFPSFSVKKLLPNDRAVHNGDSDVSSSKKPLTIIDLIRDMHRRKLERLFPPFLFNAGDVDVDDDSGLSKGVGGSPSFNVFRNVIGPNFTKHLKPLDLDVIHSLPSNYTNSTSQVHHDDGTKTVVNQTIHKNSGDDFHHFFHVKTVHVVPHYGDEKPVEDAEEPEATDTTESEIVSLPEEADVADPEVSINDVLNNSVYPEYYYDHADTINKIKRSALSPQGSEKKILFPTNKESRFEENRSTWSQVQKGKGNRRRGSKSYVYKNLGGKSYLYSVDHAGKNEKRRTNDEDETIDNNVDAEVSGTIIPPPDLSRDTRVNPDGSYDKQQGISMTDPDAEVFDLSLVIKEMESRANAE